MSTKKAATVAELQELHAMVARSLSTRIAQDTEDGLPTDAATIQAAIKFLKDNNVTADPADSDNLSELREKLAEQSRQRKAKLSNVIAMADKQVKEA